MESNNHLSWSRVGDPPILEKNASHNGVNIIGATEILTGSHAVADVFNSTKSITSNEVKDFLQYLMDINPNKILYVIWDNAKFHTSRFIRSFINLNSDNISTIQLPRYSPQMNPQENIWNWLKARLYKPSARKSIDELICNISNIMNELNLNQHRIYSLANYKSFLM